MSQYYNTRPPLPRTNAINLTENGADAPVLSEFDKLRETLLTADAEEGWASELRRYMSTMQRDVTKHTDLVEWWQVSHSPFCLCLFGPYPDSSLHRTMRNYTLRLHVLRLMYFRLRRHLFPVNGYFRVLNKLQSTAVHI